MKNNRLIEIVENAMTGDAFIYYTSESDADIIAALKELSETDSDSKLKALDLLPVMDSTGTPFYQEIKQHFNISKVFKIYA